jgi:SNF2 family DNA or RNA helicase
MKEVTMLVLECNYNKKSNKLNLKYFNIKLIPHGMADLERCHTVLSYIADKKFIEKEDGTLDYYKVPLELDSFISLHLGLHSNPAVKLEISTAFKATYDSFYIIAQQEAVVREKEFRIMAQLHGILKTTKTPVIKNYEFPKFKLRRHQLLMMTASILVRKCAYLVQMGLGKTAPALHTYAYRKQKGEVKKGIICCPKTLCYKWAEEEKNEIDKHTNLKGIVLDGNVHKRAAIIKRYVTDPSIDLLITPYSFWSRDNVNEYAEIKNANPQMYIIDESHYVKNPDANVTANITEFCKGISNGILLSGSPAPNNLTDVFSQYGLIDKSIFGTSYYAFLHRFFYVSDDGKKQLIKPDKKEEVRTKIHSKAIVIKSEDCVDLPEKVYENVYIKMTQDYLDQLYEVDDSCFDSIKEGRYEFNPALIKLLISCSGWVYDENKKAVRFKNTPKLDALRDLLTTLVVNEGNKLVLWYNYIYDIVILEELLNELGITFITVSAAEDTESKARIQKVNNFESTPSIQVLLGSPSLLSEGIDIFSTPYNVYWNLTFRFDKIDQSEARTRRLDSIKYWKHVFYYRFIMQDTVEEIVLKALERKLSYKELIFGVQQYIKKARVLHVR